MQNQEYIHIGSKVLSKDVFRKVLRPLNNFLYMPSGGLFACPYKGPDKISEWYQFLISDPDIAKYKNINAGVIFHLKKEANILVIDSYSKVLELIKKYPSHHQIKSYIFPITEDTTLFDFESLQEDYDGIYVNYSTFILCKPTTAIFNNWIVNTLLLFNLDCIESYLPVNISNYALNIAKEPKEIAKPSIYYEELSKYIASTFPYIMNSYDPCDDYDAYLTSIAKTITTCLSLLKTNKQKTIINLLNYLEENEIKKTLDNIIKNIILNYLVTYFQNNNDKIKKLAKSKITVPKQYTY